MKNNHFSQVKKEQSNRRFTSNWDLHPYCHLKPGDWIEASSKKKNCPRDWKGGDPLLLRHRSSRQCLKKAAARSSRAGLELERPSCGGSCEGAGPYEAGQWALVLHKENWDCQVLLSAEAGEGNRDLARGEAAPSRPLSFMTQQAFQNQTGKESCKHSVASIFSQHLVFFLKEAEFSRS